MKVIKWMDWQNGILGRRSLQVYATEYYRHVEAFPDYLLTLATRSERTVVGGKTVYEAHP